MKPRFVDWAFVAVVLILLMTIMIVVWCSL